MKHFGFNFKSHFLCVSERFKLSVRRSCMVNCSNCVICLWLKRALSWSLCKAWRRSGAHGHKARSSRRFHLRRLWSLHVLRLVPQSSHLQSENMHLNLILAEMSRTHFDNSDELWCCSPAWVNCDVCSKTGVKKTLFFFFYEGGCEWWRGELSLPFTV